MTPERSTRGDGISNVPVSSVTPSQKVSLQLVQHPIRHRSTYVTKVLSFIAWVLKQAWKYGYTKVKAAANWAYNNYRTVLRWIEAGVSWGTILEWIINYYI